MKIVDTVRIINNSVYICIPKKLVELMNLKKDDFLEVEFKKINQDLIESN